MARRRTAPAGLNVPLFAHQLAAATDRAFAGADVARRDVVIAGVAIGIQATDPELLRTFTAALAHHPRLPAGTEPDSVVRIWSAAATGVPRPEMPAAIRERIVNRAADLVPGADYHLDFDPTGRMLTAMHPDSGDVTVCLSDVAHLPDWERAAPLRTALGWILRRHDRHLLHCAAVSDDDGAAALLVGRGGAGKSTTALRCRAGGMGFLGDDICAVGPGPQPRVSNVYGTAKTVWRDLGRFPDLAPVLTTDPGSDRDYKAVYALNRLPDSRIVADAEPRVIVLLDRTAAVGVASPVPAAVVVATVATTTSSFLPGSGRPMLSALGELARRVPIVRTAVGADPDRAAPLIRAVIAGAPALRGSTRGR